MGWVQQIKINKEGDVNSSPSSPRLKSLLYLSYTHMWVMLMRYWECVSVCLRKGYVGHVSLLYPPPLLNLSWGCCDLDCPHQIYTNDTYWTTSTLFKMQNYVHISKSTHLHLWCHLSKYLYSTYIHTCCNMVLPVHNMLVFLSSSLQGYSKINNLKHIFVWSFTLMLFQTIVWLSFFCESQ